LTFGCFLHESLPTLYTVLDGSLRDRPAYRQAQNTGHSITETRFAGLNERADTLIQSLIDRVTNG
ncbi:hypothetical protein WAU26_21780, partial [Xanthomonas phaseoli pv. dieffenbachiae]